MGQRRDLSTPAECATADAFQQLVAHVVAERVVDGLEIVEVHEQDGQGLVVAHLAFQGVLDTVAEQIIHSSMKIAAAEGAGFGLGGFITIIPDFSILAAITLRTIQKLSLVYGFEFNTDEEMAELWIAAASAAGVDLGRDLLEKNVVNRLIPRIIQRIAAKASTEFVEKWAGRLIPVASSIIGGVLNYYFVRGWGERAHAHFRQKHLQLRQRTLQQQTIEVASITS